MRFCARSSDATALTLCLFEGERETRLPMVRQSGDLFALEVANAGAGTRYGLRADGVYAPDQGLWFDPDKLLVDPYAVELDRRFAHDARLALPRGSGFDTAPIVPKAIVRTLDPAPKTRPRLRPDGLIYEINVRGFTRLHPDICEPQRGTIAALAHPAVIAHLQKLRVCAVELMPVTAWIDERHLTPLGLGNAWGYNPVALMALDPGLAPGGIAELAAATEALHAAGIGVILDLVFNHTGESDRFGPTLSMRGLDNRTYYAHDPHDPGLLINDTGCGNTLACHRPVVRQLVLDTLRHFVIHAGIDGFRFDLAPILARTPTGFDATAPLFDDIRHDPVLSDRIMIAEPWDCGPGGYQLGAFPDNFLEWNDRYRDDVRRFWRGDRHCAGDLATRLAGSADIFAARGARASRTVNFLAAHDGFTLADLVSHERRHNETNGEHNRDGHGENFSWNNGAEGETDNPAIAAARQRDIRALLATLFASRGAIMLTAGDEFGRTQRGNNNAYAQDNPITWIDWAMRDIELEDFTAALSAFRANHPQLGAPDFLDQGADLVRIDWLDLTGASMAPHDWSDAEGFELVLTTRSGETLCVRIDRRDRTCTLRAS